MALDFKKKILLHKPIQNARGQYNYGRIDNSDKRVLGLPENFNYGGEEIELFTVVDHIPSTWEIIPGGNIWLYKDSAMEIKEMYIYGHGQETDKNRFYDHEIATYLFDSDRTGIFSDTVSGTTLRDSYLGTGNNTWTNERSIAYKDKGTFEFNSSCSEATGFLGLARTGDFCNYGLQNSGYYSTTSRVVYDIPYEGHSKTNDSWSVENVFNTDEINFTQALTGNITDSYYYLVTRVSGDESEYSPIGHGWLDLTGGYKSDELQRSYAIYSIHKQLLFDVYVKSQPKTICWTDNSLDDSYATSGAGGTFTPFISWSDSECDIFVDVKNPSKYYTAENVPLTFKDMDWNTALSSKKKFIEAEDNRSGHGHDLLKDGTGVAYRAYAAKIKFNPPSWSPEKAEQAGFKWTKKTTFGQLNPEFNMDFTGFPDVFYQTEGKFFDSDLIKDFRPLSKINSTIDTFGDKTDLQTYYPKGSDYAFNSSAPLTVNLQFDLVKNIDSFNPKYFSNEEDPSLNEYGIKYGWFVVNWEWDSQWPGGATLDRISSLDFPRTEADTINRQINFNTYKLKLQGDTSVDETEYEFTFPVHKNEAVHTYNTPGVKVIKVVFMTYIESNHFGTDAEGTAYAGNYIQAIQWKLATVKINLGADASYTNDFSDIGGADYTYLPYPEVLQYDYPIGDIKFDEGATEKQLWCEDGRNTPIDVVIDESIICESKSSSHPVISGLSEESTYIQSLKSLLNQDKWDMSEGEDKLTAEISLDNSPFQSKDEYGNYLGKTDLSTTRYFNRPFIMHDFLDLNNDSILNNYSDVDFWDGINNKFPMKSPATSIFISEYPILHDKCLTEINFDSLDGVTIRDTSGNGCKGIVFGDFSVMKDEKGQPSQRDSSIDIPKLGTDNDNKAY